ncbi:MAG: hypothetical protein AUK28_05790 [Desulfobacterales bacterium CG2_30_60_27]|nr:MAG: hypothetical protein AUK28_05790 [Desulfobacterales bacterium CG2_30_60_27]
MTRRPWVVLLAVLLAAGPVLAAEPSMVTYTLLPPFLANAAKPNILIILDNSLSMNLNAYGSPPDATGLVPDEPYIGPPACAGDCRSYYGYFNADWFYHFSGARFVHKYRKMQYQGDACINAWQVADTTGALACLDNAHVQAEQLWDGNWLNWATMRRIDVARKVLMGGRATAPAGAGHQTVYGEVPSQAGQTFIKFYDSNLNGGAAGSPYPGSYYYGLAAGELFVSQDSNPFAQGAHYPIAVDKQEACEPNDFLEHNLAGVLQHVGDLARWGNEFFNQGTGVNGSGGFIANPIGAAIQSIGADLQNTGADTRSPLAEAFYVAMQYFRQQDVQAGLDYPSQVIPHGNPEQDPYYNGEEFVPCARGFVILLSDGVSTKDSKIPAAYKDYDDDGDHTACDEDTGNNCDSAAGGTDFLDDLALYAHTVDLRPDLAGEQHLDLYPIFTFGNEPAARQLMQDAARNGGFADSNNNQKPDLHQEWDANNDGLPDAYFEASDGARLEGALQNAIAAILAKTASGTTVSMLATSSTGEGNVVQASFAPRLTKGSLDGGSLESATWVGSLQALWVDPRGLPREDTNQDRRLEVADDRVLRYRVDEQGNTLVDRYAVSAASPYPDLQNDTPLPAVAMADLRPVWEAGAVLAATPPEDRTIYTSLDNATFTAFANANATAIRPYLGVKDGGAWGYLGESPGDRAANLIRYIRGQDTGLAGATQVRNRTINGRTLKLGDIIHATPVSVAGPPDRFGLLYGDLSYEAYAKKYTPRREQGAANVLGRETMVYAGANDGMLHAFTSWLYDAEGREFIKPAGAGAGETIGAELWAYIPQALLPHLKWLARQDYGHVYYVDLPPKVGDARIFADDDVHPDGWGTVLIGGLGLGGKEIEVTDDFNHDGNDVTRRFVSSYFAIDITKPRAPRLLWEKSYEDLGLTTCTPAIIKVGPLDFKTKTQDDKWFLVLGSGPSADQGSLAGFNGQSVKNGHVYIIDLATGEPYRHGAHDWLFATDDPKAFLGGAAGFDMGLNYNVDAIYLTEAHEEADGASAGALYKVTVPWVCTAGDCGGVAYGSSTGGAYVSDPLDLAHPWRLTKIFAAPRPVTAPPALSLDFDKRVWIYFGTGRYFSLADRTSKDQEYLYGVMDPFFNQEHRPDPAGFFDDSFYHNADTALTVSGDTLLDAAGLMVMAGGGVYRTVDLGYYGDFTHLLRAQRQKNGWQRRLVTPGERALAKPVISGGLALFTTFAPSPAPCDYGGRGALHALYFETGTAYKRPVFDNGVEDVILPDIKAPMPRVKETLDLGQGQPACPALHVGQEADGSITAYIQQSTGELADLPLTPAFKVRSGLRYWKDMTVE